MNDADSTPADPKSGLKGSGLRGQTVIVTRPAGQAAVLAEKIESRGGRAIICPVIEIRPPEVVEPLEAAIERLSGYDLAVFASRNGVEFFSQYLNKASARLSADLRVAAIGSSTAASIQDKWGLNAITPDNFNSEQLAEFLTQRFQGAKLLLVRGDRGSQVLPDRLAAANIEFDSVVAYRSTDVDEIDDEIARLLKAGKVDWVTATSSSIGRASVRLFGDYLAGGGGEFEANKAKLVSISPTTSRAIRAAGSEPAAEATEYHLDGLIAAMLKFCLK